MSRILLWNDGKEAITKNDIAKADPLRIMLDQGADILAVNIFAITSDACEIDIPECIPGQVNKNEIPISFSFLNFRDGFALEVIHNGPTNHAVRLCGTFVGAKAEHYEFNVNGWPNNGFWGVLGPLLLILCLMPFGMLSLFLGRAFGEEAFVISSVIFAFLFAIFVPSLATILMPSAPKQLRAAITYGIRPLFPRSPY